MNKYASLEKFLLKKSYDRIPLSFEDIEVIIQNKLPPSARKHRAWWSNNPSNSVITHAWLGAGYRTAEVNLEGERVTFVRDDSRDGPVPMQGEGGHPLIGCAENTVTFEDEVDLTEPALPEWKEIADTIEMPHG